MSKKTPFVILKRFLIWFMQAFDGMRIRILPQSLFYRFILIILLPLIFLQTGMFIFFYDRHWQTVSRRLAADVAGELTLLADYISSGIDERNINMLISKASHDLSLKLTFKKQELILNQRLNYEDSSVQHLTNELANMNYPVHMSSITNKRLLVNFFYLFRCHPRHNKLNV